LFLELLKVIDAPEYQIDAQVRATMKQKNEVDPMSWTGIWES
jgi:hypothetical protein